MSHSQSEPVSLQPRSSTTAVAAQPAPVPSNLLLLQTVEKTVINPESSALMQECSDEEDIILAHSGRFCQKMFQRHHYCLKAELEGISGAQLLNSKFG